MHPAVALEKLDIRVGYTRPGVGGPLGQLFRMLAETVHELTLGADDGAVSHALWCSVM